MAAAEAGRRAQPLRQRAADASRTGGGGGLAGPCGREKQGARAAWQSHVGEEVVVQEGDGLAQAQPGHADEVASRAERGIDARPPGGLGHDLRLGAADSVLERELDGAERQSHAVKGDRGRSALDGVRGLPQRALNGARLGRRCELDVHGHVPFVVAPERLHDAPEGAGGVQKEALNEVDRFQDFLPPVNFHVRHGHIEPNLRGQQPNGPVMQVCGRRNRSRRRPSARAAGTQWPSGSDSLVHWRLRLPTQASSRSRSCAGC